MTHPQFCKFKTDWNVFKRITNIPDNQIHAVIQQLWWFCPNSLVNSVTDFFTLTEAQLLSTLKQIVTKKSNPAVHCLQFSSIIQSDGESIKDYVIWLKSVIPDCEYVCPNCQFIRGIQNESLQTDILAKASLLKLLEEVVKHAEAFETTQWNQTQLHPSLDPLAACISDYKCRNHSINLPNDQQSDKRTCPCAGCGSYSHG